MTCIIIDDEATARAIVAHHCSKVANLDVIEEFDNAIDGLKFLNQQNIEIVLTTSDTEFAIEAYEYEAIVDYLVKPITDERFEKSIQKIKNSFVKSPTQKTSDNSSSEIGDDLYINIDRRLIKLNFNEILVIEAKGDYIDIKTETKEYHVHTTLKKIKEKLPEKLFLQIHRSFIINFSKIIDIEDNSVLIDQFYIVI